MDNFKSSTEEHSTSSTPQIDYSAKEHTLKEQLTMGMKFAVGFAIFFGLIWFLES